MDPDANLREQRALVQKIQVLWNSATSTNDYERELAAAANELAELIQALDQWISRGGFLPAAWRKQRHAPARHDRTRRVRQTACRHCGQDIENFSPYHKGEWRDRGNNTHCPTPEGDAGRLHAPVRK